MFSNKKQVISVKPKPWITSGIRISCANKKKLYETYRSSRDQNCKLYYKKYCKTLTTIITESKKKYYEETVIKSTNKNKRVWNIVNKLTNRRNNPHKIIVMNINNNLNNNSGTIANAFNSFFLQ